MTIVDDVKARSDIVDVVGAYVSLQKSGQNFKGLCPFHSERTASFYVSPERQTWRCFGACADGGDVISFVTKRENVPFGEALERLATQAGVPLPQKRPVAETQEEDRILAVNEMAAEFYRRLLETSAEGEEARGYLDRRHITPEGREAFAIGLSPGGWDGLKHYLDGLGVDEGTQLRAGLLIQRDGGGTYDRFRGRLMFPIRNRQGRTVGFGGRSLDNSNPKYLNTSQSPVFDKSALLYGIDRAQAGMRASGVAVIVEGYTDVVQAHQHGFENVVASMGTALTERQVGLLRNLAKQYVLALDPDAAGQQATRRSLETAWGVFRQGGLPDLRMAALPDGADPDELIARDPEEWSRRVSEATPVLEYIFQQEAAQASTMSAAEKQQVVERLFPLVAALENTFEQDRYFTRLAEVLGIDARALAASVGRPGSRSRQRRGRDAAPREIVTSALESRTREQVGEHLLTLLLRNPGFLPDVTALQPEVFHDSENRALFVYLVESGGDAVADGPLEETSTRLHEVGVPKMSDGEYREALQSCARRLQERHLRQMKAEERILDGAETGNFEHETDKEAALERADRLKEHFHV